MTENTWPDPTRPGVPLNPEKDGWHWLEDTVDGVGTGHLEAAYYVVCAVPAWYRAGNRAPITKIKQWRYLGPALTPEEAAALQARADRNAAEYARVDDKARLAEFLHKQEIAAKDARIAELEEAVRRAVECIVLSWDRDTFQYVLQKWDFGDGDDTIAAQGFLYDTLSKKLKSKWICPINHSECVKNCGSYGCGN